MKYVAVSGIQGGSNLVDKRNTKRIILKRMAFLQLI